MSHSERTLLLVQSSAKGDDSITRALARDLAERLAAQEGSEIVLRDLAKGVETIDPLWVGANFTPPEARTEAMSDRLAGSDALVAEVMNADTLVLGMPMYNFGPPGPFKSWIDLVIRAGVTFRYSEAGPVGLVENKRAFIVMASGGTPVDGPMDFATPWLKHTLGFLGITDVTVVAADRSVMRDDAVSEAQAAIDALAPRNAA